MNPSLPPDNWSNQLPSNVIREISDAVKRQSTRLPVDLFAEWFSPPVRLPKSWFQQASKYIEIPHPEYWSSGEESVELTPPEETD
ncbi:MAG: hypothetical protein AB1861_08300 [Cyanobacteriota bacterium]